MSEYLQNNEYKQDILKGLINDLHSGRAFEEVKREFGQLVEGVGATEIADMEQRLINEGMPPEEIKKLCDVHAALFKDALSKNEQPELVPGHPIHTLKHENEEAGKVLNELEGYIQELSGAGSSKQATVLKDFKEKVIFLKTNIDKHYSKKENVFFPYLERRNITGPPSVMWSVDDEIRDLIKEVLSILNRPGEKNQAFVTELKDAFMKMKDKMEEMFFKEDNILAPMMKDALTEEEWQNIKAEEPEFGVIFSRPEQDLWHPQALNKEARPGTAADTGSISLDTGALTPQEINMILTNLPIDITFVDKNDVVRYFSQSKERVFTRTKSIIGRKVQNCHPPESVHMVEKIVNDFKNGKHNVAEFWLELNGSFVYIRYVALRDEQGEYLGTMEVTQDLTKLRALKGERRLLQYSE